MISIILFVPCPKCGKKAWDIENHGPLVQLSYFTIHCFHCGYRNPTLEEEERFEKQIEEKERPIKHILDEIRALNELFDEKPELREWHAEEYWKRKQKKLWIRWYELLIPWK